MTSESAPGGAPDRRALGWIVLLGVFVAALTLRTPVIAPSAVMGEITRDFGLDSGTAGLITTAPVLMFALMTSVAALLIRRRGPDLAVLLTLVGVIIGSLIRLLPGFGSLLAGMIVIGASITIGNVVMPVIIRREVAPGRVATATAAYTATMNIGSLAASIGTAPLATLLGWHGALFAWSAIAVVGVVVWSVHLARRPRTASAAGGLSSRGADDAPDAEGTARDGVAVITGPSPVVSRDAKAGAWRPVTILLLLAFGAQSGAYFALTTWLPTIAADELGVSATDAGVLASLFQGVAIAGAFLVPLLLRWRGPLITAAVIGSGWMTVMLGMALAPRVIVLWLIVGGVAQAGGFVTIFSFLVAAARSDREAATMSAIVQGGGYVLSTLGAPMIGAVHDATGEWTVPLLVLFGVTVVFTTSLLTVARLRR